MVNWSIAKFVNIIHLNHKTISITEIEQKLVSMYQDFQCIKIKRHEIFIQELQSELQKYNKEYTKHEIEIAKLIKSILEKELQEITVHRLEFIANKELVSLEKKLITLKFKQQIADSQTERQNIKDIIEKDKQKATQFKFYLEHKKYLENLAYNPNPTVLKEYHQEIRNIMEKPL